MGIRCPICDLECEGEDVRDTPWFLECECGCIFYYDSYRDKYYNSEGEVIK